jgi:hypothetical protein
LEFGGWQPSKIEENRRQFYINLFVWPYIVVAKIKECLPIDKAAGGPLATSQIIRIRLISKRIVENVGEELFCITWTKVCAVTRSNLRMSKSICGN